MTGFRWTIESITPRLLQTVGYIILEWSMIDHEVTRMCELFWFNAHPGEKLSRRFDRRVTILKDFVKELYTKEYPNEPDEYRIFAWYLQRLKTSNGKRDALAHGLPGTITEGRRKFEGLMVPEPSRNARFVQMSLTDIDKLAEEMRNLHIETIQVSTAISKAQAAASPNKSAGLIDGVWTQLTKENRSPKLPRGNLPPPTFQE